MNKPSLPVKAHIHMIGISGAGMSGLAVILSELGYRVSGSDKRTGNIVKKLERLGATVYIGHDGAHVCDDADLVVASAAVPEDNPEMVAAREKGIRVISRAQMLGMLMDGNHGIAVAGTHGKTTTTSMLALVLEEAELDPTVLIGGDVDKLGGNAVLGKSDLFLAEACEAFNSFQELSPRIALVTNIEADHLDCHGSLEGVKTSFCRFLSRIVDGGIAVMCGECENVKSVIPSVERRVIVYGFGENMDFQAYDIDVSTPEPSFKVRTQNASLGEYRLRVPGVHNVLNALGTIAVAIELGIEPSVIRKGLLEFNGVGRRFEELGAAHGITVIDDYAHHPTEVHATLTAARAWNRRIVVAFQPHLFSRTQLLAKDFAKSLREADVVFVTEVYPAREEPIPGVSGNMIVELINSAIPGKARFVADKGSLPDEIIPVLENGDMLIVMGAGDIRAAGEAVLRRLEAEDGE